MDTSPDPVETQAEASGESSLEGLDLGAGADPAPPPAPAARPPVRTAAEAAAEAAGQVPTRTMPSQTGSVGGRWPPRTPADCTAAYRSYDPATRSYRTLSGAVRTCP